MVNCKERNNIFQEEFDLIESKDVKELLKNILAHAPAYFFTVAASTSGKYHPESSLGLGGLVRHTKTVCKLVIEIYHLEMYGFTKREQELLIVAAISHDILKCGEDEKMRGTTVKNHPELASHYVQECNKKEQDKDGNWLYYVPQTDIKFVAGTVLTHMGQWGEIKPKTEAQKFLHLCDMLASRKNIEYKFSKEELEKTTPSVNPKEVLIDFGKYKGKTLLDIAQTDRGYLEWIISENGIRKEPIYSMTKNFLENGKKIKS